MKYHGLLFTLILILIAGGRAITGDPTGFSARSDSFSPAELAGDPYYDFVISIKSLRDRVQYWLGDGSVPSGAPKKMKANVDQMIASQTRFLESFKTNADSAANKLPFVAQAAKALQDSSFEVCLSDWSKSPTFSNFQRMSGTYAVLIPSDKEMAEYYFAVKGH